MMGSPQSEEMCVLKGRSVREIENHCPKYSEAPHLASILRQQLHTLESTESVPCDHVIH